MKTLHSVRRVVTSDTLDTETFMTNLKDRLKEDEEYLDILDKFAIFMVSQADFTIASQLLDKKIEMPTNQSTGNPGNIVTDLIDKCSNLRDELKDYLLALVYKNGSSKDDIIAQMYGSSMTYINENY